jgi:hypothetical protein
MPIITERQTVTKLRKTHMAGRILHHHWRAPLDVQLAQLDALYSTQLQVDGVEVDPSHVIAHSRFGKGPAQPSSEAYERVQTVTAAGHVAYFSDGGRDTTVM